LGAAVTSPLVSVVLSVRNGAADLPRAIDTILAQTFRDFELIAINNGSTDGTAAVLDGLHDPRVRVFHQHDIGLAGALNRGISLARGRYIARQDHDDWAKRSRLEQQVAFLEANPRCALLGTRAEIWVGDTPTNRVHDHPTNDAELRFELLFNNYFVHSSVMMRSSAVREIGGYSTDPKRQPPEDYELWSRLARRFEIANLPERLTIYREIPKSMSRQGAHPFLEPLIMISAENIAFAEGCEVPGQDHWNIAALTHGAYATLSPNYNIERMCQIVREAGRRIQSTAPDFDLSNRIRAAVTRLWHRHAEYKSGLWSVRSPQLLARPLGVLVRMGKRIVGSVSGRGNWTLER
jgi:glycosyltransferase involved in cell wall biosynthesis